MCFITFQADILSECSLYCVQLSMIFWVFNLQMCWNFLILIFPSELHSKVTSTTAQTTKVTSPSLITHRTSYMYTLEETTSDSQPQTSTGTSAERKNKLRKQVIYTQNLYRIITILIGDLRDFISYLAVSLQIGESLVN